MRRALLVSSIVALPFLLGAFGGHARRALAADCSNGPQSGLTSAATETGDLRLDVVLYNPRASSEWIQQFAGSVSFIVSDPGGTRTVAAQATVGRAPGSTFHATVPGPIAPGAYEVHAQWQVGCTDGTSALRTSPTVSFTIKRTDRPKPDFACCGPGSAAAGAACDSDNPVDEPYGVEVFLTTNGSRPTGRSRHYGTFMPHGCARPVTLRTIHRYPARCVAVTLEEDGGIAVTVTTHGALDPTRHRCTSSPPRLVRTLFVVNSGSTVIGAMRVRFLHQPNDRRDFISSTFDSGPCPVHCWHG
jgi:hypothetical protein